MGNNHMVSCSMPSSPYYDMEAEQERNEREQKRKKEWEKGSLLFKVSKLIAEADSIGEGYSYCCDYDLEYHKSDGSSEYRDLAKEIIRTVRGKR